MQKSKSTIATDPHTGLSYDFQPLFDFVQRQQGDLDIVSDVLRQGVRYCPYLFLQKDEFQEHMLIGYVGDVNDLYDAFLKITTEAAK